MGNDTTQKPKTNWLVIIMTAVISGIIAICTGLIIHHFTKENKAEPLSIVAIDSSSRPSIPDTIKPRIPDTTKPLVHEKPPVQYPEVRQKKQGEPTPTTEPKQDKIIPDKIPDPIPPVQNPVADIRRILNAEDKAELDQLDPKTTRIVKYFHKTFDNESIQFANQIKDYLFDKGIKGTGIFMGRGNFDAPGKRFIIKPTAKEDVLEIWVQVMK